MSWLSRVRNGIQGLTKRQHADNLWHKCAKCDTMVFTKEWEDNNFVCPRCEPSPRRYSLLEEKHGLVRASTEWSRIR